MKEKLFVSFAYKLMYIEKQLHFGDIQGRFSTIYLYHYQIFYLA